MLRRRRGACPRQPSALPGGGLGSNPDRRPGAGTHASGPGPIPAASSTVSSGRPGPLTTTTTSTGDPMTRPAFTVDDVLADIRRGDAARAWERWVDDALAVAASAA